MLRAALLALALMSGGAAAEEMASSLRPQPNPAYFVAFPARMPAPAAADGEGAFAEEPAALPVEGGFASSVRPMPRPKGLRVAEPEPAATAKRKKEKVSQTGSVCGAATIKGKAIAPITSRVKGCGLNDGVQVDSVSGVRLSPSITVDCATAKALNTWVADVVQPVYGGAVVEVKIAAHYICRTRNNKKGAKISEHGRGKALDVAGFVLDSGKVVAVLGGYDKKMRKVHKGACGLFSTTLGPGSDGYHEDHLHFDTASHRSGPYCR